MCTTAGAGRVCRDSEIGEAGIDCSPEKLCEGGSSYRLPGGRDWPCPGEAACLVFDTLPRLGCCLFLGVPRQMTGCRGLQLRHAGTFLLDQEVSAWGCHPGSKLSQ